MTIKLADHITMGQIKSWIKKDCIFEMHGFNGFIITENAYMVNIINNANRKG